MVISFVADATHSKLWIRHRDLVGGKSLPTDDQSLVSDLLAEVKVHSTVGDTNLERLDLLCSKLRSTGVDTILLGCTELTSLMPRFAKHGLKVFDSNQALAGSALKLVMGKQSQTAADTSAKVLSA